MEPEGVIEVSLPPYAIVPPLWERQCLREWWLPTCQVDPFSPPQVLYGDTFKISVLECVKPLIRVLSSILSSL